MRRTTSWLLNWLVRLYPHAWRDRYADEMLALLEQHTATPRTYVSLFLCVLDARFDPAFRGNGVGSMVNSTRRAALRTFWAYVLFLVAGIGLAQVTNPALNDATASAALLPSYHVLVGAALVTLAAVLVGGLPIGLAVVRAALTERRASALLALAVPVVAVIVQVGVTLVLEHVFPPRRLNPVDVLPDSPTDLGSSVGLVSWFVALLLAAVVSAIAVSRGTVRVQVDAARWRFALLPAAVATLAMGVAAGAALIFSLTAQARESQTLFSVPGSFLLFTPGWSLTMVGGMALATLAAAGFSVAGLRSTHCEAPQAAGAPGAGE